MEVMVKSIVSMKGVGAVLAFWGALGGGSGRIDFDGLRAGATPPNWVIERARVQVKLDPTAPSQPNVLQLTPEQQGKDGSSLALFNPVVCRDGDVTVKFRMGSGPSAKGAGIVWRYRDADNYYLLDFSADRKDIQLIRVKDGVALPLRISGTKVGATGVFHDLKAGQWYVARVIFRGDSIRVMLGNRKLFEAWDSGLQVAGRSGVSSRGGNGVSFDDFRIEKHS